MPFRTQNGSHYHEREGCCGAHLPCEPGGKLDPCAICCDIARINVSIGATATADDAPSGGVPGTFATDEAVTASHGEENDMHLPLDDAEAGDEAADSGKARAEANDVLSAIVVSPDAKPEDVPAIEQAISEFLELREIMFRDVFRTQNLMELRRWYESDYIAWQKRNVRTRAIFEEELMKNSKYAENEKLRSDKVKRRMRGRYKRMYPPQNHDLYERVIKHREKIPYGDEASWPGYEESKELWDEQTVELWRRRCEKKGVDRRVNAAQAFVRSVAAAYDKCGSDERGRRKRYSNIIDHAKTGETIISDRGGTVSEWDVIDPSRLWAGFEPAQATPVFARDDDGNLHQFIRCEQNVAFERDGDDPWFSPCGSWFDITDPDNVVPVSKRGFEKQFRRLWV